MLQLQSACSFVRSSVIRGTRAQDTITCNDSRVRVRVRSAAALSFVLVRVCRVFATHGETPAAAPRLLSQARSRVYSLLISEREATAPSSRAQPDTCRRCRGGWGGAQLGRVCCQLPPRSRTSRLSPASAPRMGSASRATPRPHVNVLPRQLCPALGRRFLVPGVNGRVRLCAKGPEALDHPKEAAAVERSLDAARADAKQSAR